MANKSRYIHGQLEMEEGVKLTNLWALDRNFFWEANKTVNKLCSFSLLWTRRGENGHFATLGSRDFFLTGKCGRAHITAWESLPRRTKTPDFFYQCTVSRNSDLSFIFTIIHVLFEIFEPCFFHGLLTIYLLECLSSFEVEMRLIQNQERN